MACFDDKSLYSKQILEKMRAGSSAYNECVKDALVAKGFEITRDYAMRIAVDEKHSRVCIVKSIANLYIYSFKDILASEVVVEEGEEVSKIDTTTTTSRGSQLGGAAIGGLIAGPAGLVVGGLSGKKKSTGTARTFKEIKKIALNIIVKNSQTSVHSICFLLNSNTNSSDYSSALSDIREWHAYLTVLIKKAVEEQANDCVQEKDKPKSLSTVAIEICGNCDRRIGRLEQAYVFKDQIVCHECHQKLVG